ncbi:DeoR/GlpR family DNA-binding transcription regulator [Lysinibacillus odysseyi]|uniref:HTH deoR-type domain-containing protein n=1 Tax=Lysinibacillus odysseyi 34hs-1 = NBRC 100172 TaxID=1220589 RepID=A0A0A3J3C9_9BACI|nr:DeoR/GlpR family DNA-binding transcription regulator [Lysinibacillus odysseyi]KGR81552.1 hypothetical protein CD32_19545 [Lysinibacillus odysseyi 34hs-1 = NBRC 100172]
MYPIERQNKILEILAEEKIAKINLLSTRLGVSMETIRRDIHVLAQQGLITKFYGGIKLAGEASIRETSLSVRMSENRSHKEEIGLLCADLIEERDTVFIDSGTTTLHIAKHLKKFKHITVVTNSIPVLLELLDTDLNVIIIGGKLRQSENSITSLNFLFNFDRLNITKAFICTSGVSIESGLSDYNMEEVQTRQQIIQRAKTIFAVTDHTKFEKDVAVKVCGLEDIDGIVTDGQILPALAAKYRTKGVEIYIAEKSEVSFFD